MTAPDQTTFYVKSLKYVGITTSYGGCFGLGPDAESREEHVLIDTHPATENYSGEERVSGYCGTTDHWSLTAHGAFETEEEARAAVTEIFGQSCEADSEWPFLSFSVEDDFNLSVVGRAEYEAARDDEDADNLPGYTVASFVCGQFFTRTLTENYTEMFLDDEIRAITEATTDEEIDALVENAEEEANDQLAANLHPKAKVILLAERERRAGQDA